MAFKFYRRPASSSSASNEVYAPTKRSLPKWQWYFLTLVIISPLLYLLGGWLISVILITAPGAVVMDSIAIRSPYDAYVKSLHVHLADKVKVGDDLITLESPILNAQIAGLQAHMALLKHQQMAYYNQNRQRHETLTELKTTAEKHVSSSLAYYKEIHASYKKGFTTIDQVSIAEERYNQALINLKQVQAEIARNNSDYSIESQRNYDQILAPESLQLIALQTIQKHLDIKASRAGIIDRVYAQNFEFVRQGMPLLTLGTKEHLHITAYFSAKDIPHIHPGQRVFLFLPDFKVLTGHITHHPSTTRREVNAFVTLQNPEKKLVTFIALDSSLPENYQVNGMPLTVILF